MAQARRPFWRTLYFWVLVAIALGVLVGWLSPESGRALKPLGDGFIKLVKMIITPVIFLTVVTGIAGMADLKAFGRVGAQGDGLFPRPSRPWRSRSASSSPISSGRAPGSTSIRRRSMPARSPTYVSQAHEQSVTGFLLNIIPDTLFSAFTEGEILQVLFVAILFGIALALLGERGERLLDGAEDADRGRLPHRPYPDVRGADRRVRGDGLHHRPIWHRHARQSRRADRHLLRRPPCCS